MQWTSFISFVKWSGHPKVNLKNSKQIDGFKRAIIIWKFFDMKFKSWSFDWFLENKIRKFPETY